MDHLKELGDKGLLEDCIKKSEEPDSGEFMDNMSSSTTRPRSDTESTSPPNAELQPTTKTSPRFPTRIPQPPDRFM